MEKNLGAVLLLFAVLGVLTVDVESRSRSDVEETATFEERSDTVQLELTASEGMSRARLRVKLDVESGRVRWTLTDPKGDLRFSDVESSGRSVGDTGDMESIPGTWLVELDLERATGSYEVGWHAR